MTDRHYFLVILFAIFTLIIPTHFLGTTQLYYKIFRLGNHVGLYYNHLGRVQLTNSKYTLLTYVDLATANQQYNQLLRSYTKSLNMCTWKPNQTISDVNAYFCQNSFRTINSRISAIKGKTQIINFVSASKSNSGNNISKRGLFDGTSCVLHWLFGTPDAKDAKFYKEAIESVIHDNRNVASC